MSAPQVTITPGTGTTKAPPDKGVVVKVGNGTLEQVSVTVKGKPVEGEMSSDKTTWRSRTLKPGTAYEVSVVARNPQGKTTTATSSFTTLKAAAPLTVVDMIPMPGEKVGVGMPITLTFNREIPDRDKKTVEQALEVRSTKPATGAWFWISDRQVIFRTKNEQYWQPNQTVKLTAELAGIRAGKGVYGTADFTRSFRIGDSHISTVNAKTKKMVVKVNGKVVKKTGISAGKGGRVVNGVDTYLTTSGIHLTMSKHRVERMTSEWMGVDPKDKKNGGYDLLLPHAVRISSTGEYVHASPDRYWAFGRYNASHGCVNTPPPFAEWFYNLSYRGDIVIVTGTKRSLPWNNGWSYYEMSWDRWVKGSALDREVTTG
ncbi:L,D-transpeptidase [Thermomonospora cellulosilytica]|uniref:Lipoprotein-anchoring transpeptidase ErfK/SrfK n=1 Tax=Thermomonospora cellulosilytica TaxID=1411118 RepID=A0A7W3N0A4_9ACTN|nr:Ig-like domain-containing protein [Thermomonospora cellulosilytica]MBA9005181.1 lipoprotein-anchoring transpeptidase ErfK/SrfK [Thermomonospora cellulosilytica]